MGEAVRAAGKFARRGRVRLLGLVTATGTLVASGALTAGQHASATTLTTLSGTVSGVATARLPDITVEALNPTTHAVLATTTTDGAGNYTLKVANGQVDEYIVPAPITGAAPSTIHVTVNGPTAVNPVLTIATAHPYTGHLFEADGVTPVQGTVCLAPTFQTDMAVRCATTNSNGVYSLPAASSGFSTASIDISGAVPGGTWTQVGSGLGGASGGDFVLPVHPLAVTVKAPGGALLAGAQVMEITPSPLLTNYDYVDPRSPAIQTGPQATTDSNGVAHLLVYGGTGASLRVVPPTSASGTLFESNLDLTTTSALSVTLPTALTYSGTLTQADGTTPVVGVLCLTPTTGLAWQQICAQSSGSGAFSMSVPAGTYTSIATLPDTTYGATLTLGAAVHITSNTTTSIALPLRNLTVDVVDPSSNAVAGAVIVAGSSNSSAPSAGWYLTSGGSFGATANASGVATVAVLAPGGVSLSVQPPAGSLTLGGVGVSVAMGNADATQNVSLPAGVTFSGLLLAPDGVTAAAGQVCLTAEPVAPSIASAGQRCATAAADGSFAMSVAPGAFYFSLTTADGLQLVAQDSNDGVQDVHISEDTVAYLEVPKATVQINVVDSAGNPVPGARVDTYDQLLFGNGSWNMSGMLPKSSATTNSAGSTTVTAYAVVPEADGDVSMINVGVVPPSGSTELSNVYAAQLPLSGNGTYTIVLDGELPATVSNVAATRTSTTATVAWSAPQESSSNYTVTLTPGNLAASVSGTVRSVTIPGLDPNTTYQVVVQGSNDLGVGPSSSPVTVTTGAPVSPGTGGGGSIPASLPPGGVTAAIAAGMPFLDIDPNTTTASFGDIVTSPVAGVLRVVDSVPTTAAAGYVPLGVETNILAVPSVDASTPVHVDLVIDVGPTPPSGLTVFSGGTAVAQCQGSATATPDPCLSQTSVIDGVEDLTLLMSHGAEFDLEVPATSGGGGGGSGGAGGGGSSSGGATAPSSSSTGRIYGTDRFGTAVAVSKLAYPDGNAGAVVLARADSYPDALVGAPLAAAKNGPLLLTSGPSLPASTQAEITRALPKGRTVYLLGGTASIPDSVGSQLSALGYVVTRISGPDRFATAVAVAQELGSPSTILLAGGMSFPDALTAGPAAAAVHGAILLTDGSTLPAATSSYLSAHASAHVYAIGGPAAAADRSATALVGTDRYATSVLVANKFFTAPTVAGVASGENFPDALAGGAYLAHAGGPLLLTASDTLPAAITQYLTSVRLTLTAIDVFGGPSAVSNDVLSKTLP
jgi:putative cell wall-binding protein